MSQVCLPSASVRGMTTPPGWYPDPQPPAGMPPAQRWWDGTAWTEHLAPAAAPVATAYQLTGPPTTPDGEELASWGRRLGAYLLDGLILLPVFVLASVPFWGQIGDAFGDYWDEATASIDTGSDGPSGAALQRELAGTILAIALICNAINFAYHVGFLMWKQATPGKLLLGLRVRRREAPGPMPLGTVLLRWLTQFGPSLLGGIRVVGYLTSLYQLLDGLWPLWDAKRQALHDKAAKTNVVRVR
jgi:uncharacterized RDD family membrane protein YckC